MTARYALYYAPPEASALWQAGSAWLGYDAASGSVVDRPPQVSTNPVARPALYGFHATLKPPLSLNPAQAPPALLHAVREVCRTIAPFALPPLTVGLLGPYLALVLQHACPPLDSLAATLVTELDSFRAPPTAAELAKRRAAPLSQAQEAMLAAYGYPDVLAEWRFHMTLSERLPPASQPAARAAAETFFRQALAEPQTVSEVCIFIQPAPGRPFCITGRVALEGRSGASPPNPHWGLRPQTPVT